MPYFEYNGEIDIDVDEFLTGCDSSEIKEIIKSLVEDGYLPQSVLNTIGTSNGNSVSESEFEDALDKLHGKYVQMTKDEEEIIIKIAKRF